MPWPSHSSGAISIDEVSPHPGRAAICGNVGSFDHVACTSALVDGVPLVGQRQRIPEMLGRADRAAPGVAGFTRRPRRPPPWHARRKTVARRPHSATTDTSPEKRRCALCTSFRTPAARRPPSWLMTFSTSAVAVWRSSASCVSLNNRTFVIAITAWSTKVCSSDMCLSLNSPCSGARCRATMTPSPCSLMGSITTSEASRPALSRAARCGGRRSSGQPVGHVQRLCRWDALATAKLAFDIAARNHARPRAAGHRPPLPGKSLTRCAVAIISAPGCRRY